jgi:hypothetical protein
MADTSPSGLGTYTGGVLSNNYHGSIINSPEISKTTGEPTQRSVRDVGMARDIVKTVIMANRNRSIVYSRILSKYAAERPYDSYKLEAEGLGWRSNFTTKPLPAMIEKVAPIFVAAVDALKYFTNSSLSNKWQNSAGKTEKFRELITKTIRARKGWRTLLEDIAFNDAIFGSAILAWLDEMSWFPKNFGIADEAFVADGTKSDPRWAQVVVLKEVYLPHELFDSIREGGSEEAKNAGWELENARVAINEASPVQIRDRLNVGGTLETWYVNAIRELTIGASYMAGNSVIVVYSLLAREVTGKVSHYRMAGPGMLKIFERTDRFDSMEDAVAFFSFQKGNGTLHGSKGIGRDIYELAGMIDRTRNEVVDRLIMSGKTMIQGDIKRIHTFKMSVIGSTVIVPTGWNVLEQKIEGNVEGFLKLDVYFQQLVNQLIGSTSPPSPEMGEAFRSPAAWNLLAQREEQGQDVRIARFLEQFTMMIATMQKRLCDADTMEDDAKEMQRELLEEMTREELDELAKQPVSGTIKDLTPLKRQLMASIAQEKKGNPLYNQRELEYEALIALTDKEFADRVLLPDADPTEEAEQTRMQNLEMTLLSHGQPVEVSPRDNHMIHLKLLLPAAEQAAGQMQQGQFGTDTLEAILAHITEHFNQAINQGIKKDNPLIQQAEELVKKAGEHLAKLKEVDQQEQQMQQGMQPPQQPLPPQTPQQ